MAGNLLEFVATKNKKLVQFFEDNHNAAKLMIKIVRLIGDICESNHISAEELLFEVYAPRGGNAIVIKLNHPTKSVST